MNNASNVVNFADIRAAKQKQNEVERFFDRFMNEVYPLLTHDDKVALLSAMESGDNDAAFEIIEPILYDNAYRKVMREMYAR